MLVGMLPETAMELLASRPTALSSVISVRPRPKTNGGDELREQTDNACDPQNMEPHLALNLEVADLINSKKGNSCVLNVCRTC